jgi:magnesium transporter
LQLAEVARQLIAGAQSRVSDLQRMYDTAVQARVENRLRLLTILSAIFLPLTLISGIYGMNFTDLPGMGIGYGYLIVIGVMLGTVLLMGWYLYRKGWFQ